jgi:hypothetical protein
VDLNWTIYGVGDSMCVTTAGTVQVWQSLAAGMYMV